MVGLLIGNSDDTNLLLTRLCERQSSLASVKRDCT